MLNSQRLENRHGPHLFLSHIIEMKPETTEVPQSPKAPKPIRKRSGTDPGIRSNSSRDIYAARDLVFSNIIRGKDNPQKVKTFHILKIIRFPDIKTNEIIKKTLRTQ